MRWLVNIIEAIWPGSVEGTDSVRVLRHRVTDLKVELRASQVAYNELADLVTERQSRQLSVSTRNRYVPGAFEQSFTIPSIGRSVAAQGLEQARRSVTPRERMMLDRAMMQQTNAAVSGTRQRTRPVTFTGPEPEDL